MRRLPSPSPLARILFVSLAGIVSVPSLTIGQGRTTPTATPEIAERETAPEREPQLESDPPTETRRIEDNERSRSDLDLETRVITATRDDRSIFRSPYSVDRVGQRLKERLYRTVPEALRDVPGTSIQKTGHGQGSPYIRGFTGYQTLMLIDGVRLNNSVFRSGPNQYWATIDPYSIDRLEILKGPGSVQYGTDAVGGVVQAFTRSPGLNREDREIGGRIFARGASAERSLIGRSEFDVTVEKNRFGILGGVTGKNFGDLEGGHHVGKQENTGYTEYDADLKAIYRVSDNSEVVALYQRARLNDAPRTHRTQDSIQWQSLSQGSDRQRDLDQERDLAYVQLRAHDLDDAIDAFRFNLSWHRQQEETDRIRSSGSRSIEGVDVNTFGAWLQAESEVASTRLVYGVEWYHDEVDSSSTSNAIQGPVGDDSQYDILGAFIQGTAALGDRVEVTLGGRATYARAETDSVQDFATGNPTDFDDDYFALTGTARAQVYLDSDEHWTAFGGVSRAFRAPNLSDLTRLDDFGTSGFEVPATGLDPEYFTQLEVGARFDDRKGTSVQAAYFYTFIDDLILRVPDRPNPSDATQTIFEKQNSGEGFVQGVEFSARFQVNSCWSAFGAVAWQDGEVEIVDSAGQRRDDTLTRLLPTSGYGGVRFDCQARNLFVEGIVRFADEQDDLSVSDQADATRIPPNGTPGYGIVSVRSGWEFREDISLYCSLENILDKDYRVHGSGVNEPGRNLVVSIEYRF